MCIYLIHVWLIKNCIWHVNLLKQNQKSKEIIKQLNVTIEPMCLIQLFGTLSGNIKMNKLPTKGINIKKYKLTSIIYLLPQKQYLVYL